VGGIRVSRDTLGSDNLALRRRSGPVIRIRPNRSKRHQREHSEYSRSFYIRQMADSPSALVESAG